MASVTLSGYECASDLLPPVCAECGRPATDRVRLRFSGHAQRAEPLLMFAWLLARQMVVRLPFCPRHAWRARWKTPLTLAGFLPVAGLIGGAYLYALGQPVQDAEGEVTVRLLCAGAAVLPIPIAITFLLSGRVRATAVTDRHLTLDRVDEGFATALADDRARSTDPLRAAGYGDDRDDYADPDQADGGAGRAEQPTDRVLLSRYECARDALPPVCARCGRPADGAIRFTIITRFTMVLVAPALVLCPPLFVAAAMWLGTRRRLRVPMCEPDRADWEWQDRATSWAYLVLACGTYVGAVGLVIDEALGDNDGGPMLVGALVYAAGWLGCIVPAGLLWRRMVRIEEMTARGAWMAGVHPEFIRAVEADRAADPARRPTYGDARDDYDDPE